jgi:hypothetical protein
VRYGCAESRTRERTRERARWRERKLYQ